VPSGSRASGGAVGAGLGVGLAVGLADGLGVVLGRGALALEPVQPAASAIADSPAAASAARRAT
jgi:hypothetical protein